MALCRTNSNYINIPSFRISGSWQGQVCRTVENDLLGSRSRDPLLLRDLWRRSHFLFWTGYSTSTVAVDDEKQYFFLTPESTIHPSRPMQCLSLLFMEPFFLGRMHQLRCLALNDNPNPRNTSRSFFSKRLAACSRLENHNGSTLAVSG